MFFNVQFFGVEQKREYKGTNDIHLVKCIFQKILLHCFSYSCFSLVSEVYFLCVLHSCRSLRTWEHQQQKLVMTQQFLDQLCPSSIKFQWVFHLSKLHTPLNIN